MRLTLPFRTSTLAFAVLVVVLLAGVVLQGRDWWHHGDASADRERALATAQRVAVGMTSLSSGASKQELARFGADLTQTLRGQLLGPTGQLSALLATAHVTSRGKALKTGLVEIDRSSARVLVGVDAAVTNASAPQGETRRYRMLVTLRDEGGHWHADTVELVP